MAWIRCMGGSGAKTVGTDKVPYLLRATPFDANLKKMKLIGGSVAFNQLLDKDNYPASSGMFTNNGDGTWTADGTAASTASLVIEDITSKVVVGHKYFVSSGFTSVGSSSTYEFMILRFIRNDANLNLYTNATIVACGFNNYGIQAQLVVRANTTVNNLKFIPQVIDLTAMFGSTIADYIYTLEQGTAGAGVAFFRKLFANDYYAYNAGELLSVKPTAHEVVGFNQWDEDWENGYYNRSTGGKAGNTDTTYFRSKNYIPCLPNTMYHFKMPQIHASNTTYFAALYYDIDKNYLTNKIVSSYPNNDASTPDNAYYMTFYVEVGTSGSTYNNDICINLSSSRDGEYEPYKKYTYPLDGTKRVYRKYGIVDLGSLTWTYINIAGSERFYSDDIKTVIAKPPLNGVANAINLKYRTVSQADYATFQYDDIFAVQTTGTIVIRDTSYTDATSFKNDLNGVYLIYELDTPFYETVTNPELRGIFKLDSNNKMYCDGDTCEDIVSPMAMMSGGTEQFVDSRAVPVPVGHESTYYSVDFPE